AGCNLSEGAARVSALTITSASLPQTALLVKLHAESFGNEAWSTEQMRGSLALTTTKAWLAFIDDKPVGLILCQVLPEEAEILTFCVSPAQRRHDVGGSLLRQAMVEILAAGAAKIMLEVAADN